MAWLTLRRLNPTDSKDCDLLQAVLEGTPKYSLMTTGEPARPDAAERVFQALPEGRNYDHKLVFGVFLGSEMVGCADLVRGYPNPETAMLGLLLIVEKHQNRGVGMTAYRTLEKELLDSWPEIATVRIGVLHGNDGAFRFWKEAGFRDTGQRAQYEEGLLSLENHVLERKVRI
jgi:RimJ/RimL family protein N-acetyltransferase